MFNNNITKHLPKMEGVYVYWYKENGKEVCCLKDSSNEVLFKFEEGVKSVEYDEYFNTYKVTFNNNECELLDEKAIRSKKEYIFHTKRSFTLSQNSEEDNYYLVSRENSKFNVRCDSTKIDIFETPYDNIDKNENFFIVEDNKKFSIFDLTGFNIMNDEWFDDIEYLEDKDCFKVQKNGLYAIIDRCGENIFDEWFEVLEEL